MRPGVEATVTLLGEGTPVVVESGSSGDRAASIALEAAYGQTPVRYRGGGSIPAMATFKEYVGVDATMMGFGLKTDNVHAPDEHFGLDRFEKGIESVIRFFHAFGNKD